MNLDDAIKSLTKLRQDKTATEEYHQQKTMGMSMMGLKNVLVSTMVELTKLLLGNTYQVTVKNFPKPKDDKKMAQHMEMMDKQMKEMNTTLHSILLTLQSSVLEPVVKSPKLNKGAMKHKM